MRTQQPQPRNPSKKAVLDLAPAVLCIGQLLRSIRIGSNPGSSRSRQPSSWVRVREVRGGVGAGRYARQQLTHNLGRVEMFVGDTPGSSAMTVGGFGKFAKRPRGLFYVAPALQSLARRERAAPARFLQRHRPSQREVAGAAVAEPTALGDDVAVLSDGELASARSKELAIHAPVRAHGCRGNEAPSRVYKVVVILPAGL